MKYDELMQQPNNILFYEDDITAPQIFQKLQTVEDDVIVREFDKDFEQSRLGLRDMSIAVRNSKDYHVYSKDELSLMNEFFTLAYLQN